MDRVEIAKEFIKRFCRGDVEGLEELLHEALRFQGPLFRFNSRSDYLESLRRDPPKKSQFRVLSVTENEEEVSIYYEYGKENGFLTIAQLFRFENDKISEILLVFDSKGLV